MSDPEVDPNDTFWTVVRVVLILSTASLSLLALRLCWQNPRFKARDRLVYSVVILALPVIGAVLYFRAQDDIDSANRGLHRKRSFRSRR